MRGKSGKTEAQALLAGVDSGSFKEMMYAASILVSV